VYYESPEKAVPQKQTLLYISISKLGIS